MLFQERYRVESSRLMSRDYAEPGKYFITICTKNREHWFGEIRNEIMGLSCVGCVIHDYWSQIPNHFLHVELDRFVVMPNHIHGIIKIFRHPFSVETCDSHVSTYQHIFSYKLRVCGGIIVSRPTPGSIGSIIGQFKSVCTKRIRTMGYTNFTWQPRFHDSIIRNNQSLHSVRSYITKNPKIWHRDRNNITQFSVGSLDLRSLFDVRK
jgi:REP element-mobilizing transposase RayT